MSEEVNQEVVEETTVEKTGPVEEVAEATTNFVDSMLEQIEDEDVKSAGFWKNLEGKNANEVGQYIKELNSFAGKKGDIPKKDATDEEWNEFYSKLGRPESPEAYDFDVNEDFREAVGEESMPYFEQAVKGFKEQAYKLGANTDQAEEMLDWYLSMMVDSTTAQKETLEEEAKQKDIELRKAWGDQYDGMERGIEALLRSNGMEDEHIEWAKKSGILKEPTLAITLGNIASRFEDDPEIGHHQTKTLAGLHDQLAEVNMDVMEYIKTGEKVPPHIAQKRKDLMDKLGDNL